MARHKEKSGQGASKMTKRRGLRFLVKSKLDPETYAALKAFAESLGFKTKKEKDGV